MNILITGSNGFIAKNLISVLNRNEQINLFYFCKENNLEDLDHYIKKIDFIFHLAGVNRPESNEEFYLGNSQFTMQLLEALNKHNHKVPILFTSSKQANLNNDYGKSKLEAEESLLKYSKKNNVPVYIYRLENVFGKWSRPNYNSVISTWCNNICRDLPIKISDENIELDLVYIDNVIESFVKKVDDETGETKCEIEPVFRKTLGEIKTTLYNFKSSRADLKIPNVGTSFERALYATYLSYLPVDKFSYKLNGFSDDRGTFYEFLKTAEAGQFSVSTSKPGVTRGNHYHHTKNEKFLVVKGEALIEFRHIGKSEKIEYHVTDKNMEVVEMIPGYTHNITNIGTEEMVLLIWANEVFEKNKPDTFLMEV